MAWVRGAGAGPGQQPPFLRNKIAQVLVCIVQVRRHLAPQPCSALSMGFKVVWQRMPSMPWLANLQQHVLFFNRSSTEYIKFMKALRYAKGRAEKLLCFCNACVIAGHILLIHNTLGTLSALCFEVAPVMAATTGLVPCLDGALACGRGCCRFCECMTLQ